VDEAGDLNLFDKKRRVLIGTPGVSKFFIVVVAFLPDIALVQETLEKLRADLLGSVDI